MNNFTDLSGVLTPRALAVLPFVCDPKKQKEVLGTLEAFALLTSPDPAAAVENASQAVLKNVLTLLRPAHPDGVGKKVHPQYSLHVLSGAHLRTTVGILVERAARSHGGGGGAAAAASPMSPPMAAPATPHRAPFARAAPVMDPVGEPVMHSSQYVREVGDDARTHLRHARAALSAGRGTARKRAAVPNSAPDDDARDTAGMLGNGLIGVASGALGALIALAKLARRLGGTSSAESRSAPRWPSRRNLVDRSTAAARRGASRRTCRRHSSAVDRLE